MGIETEIKDRCCFTGHRDIPAWLCDELSAEVDMEIERLYGIGVRHFIAGGALGFDMLCSERVLALRERLEGITLTLALPCRGHDKKWTPGERKRFSLILEKADKTVYVSEEYTRYCMFKRNRFMVDRSQYCVSFCTKKSGGTYYTVNYAASLLRDIRELSEKTL